MQQNKWKIMKSVYSASGMLDAEMMKNLLASFAIDSILFSGKALARHYGFDGYSRRGC
jgi:hypothetical protein